MAIRQHLRKHWQPAAYLESFVIDKVWAIGNKFQQNV